MIPVAVHEIARVLDGVLVRAGEGQQALGAAVDSRQVRSGDLFFALKGERVDGVEFAPQAISRGAVCVVASRPLEVPTIVVKDPYEALQDLARWELSRITPRVVGITGSIGKTTAKDALAAILRSAGMRVTATEGNFNNEIGLPLTVLSADHRTEVLVLEMGATHRGDIEHLCDIALPEVGVLTAISPVHLESFGSLEALAEAKGELALALPAEGVLVAPVGVPEAAVGGSRELKRITFGTDSSADLRASELEESGEGLSFNLHFSGHSVQANSPVFGTHLVLPLLAACGGAIALGLGLEDCAQGLARLRRTGLRGELYRLKEDIFVYDDSYNASPVAVSAVLRYGREQASRHGGRLVAVLGGMFELGARARAYHREVGQLADEINVDLLVAVGDEARWYAESFSGPVLYFNDAATAGQELDSHLQSGDYVVIKGSRGVGLELVARTLRDRLALV